MKRKDDVASSKKRRPSNRSAKGRSKYKKSTMEDSKAAAAESTNDPAWYSTSPELLRDAASIPFSWPIGTELGAAGYEVNDTVAGIATLELVQVIGSSTSKTAPANVASDAIYSFVRHANSGHSNYDAPDLMMYLVGMSSIYSFITWCQRLLGLVMSYDQRNRYISDALIKANYVDPDDLRRNIANFRFWLNALISKVSSFAIPGVMPYFSRMAFLYSNVYIEGPSIKDQLYMYVPYCLEFLQFTVDPDTSLGKLTYAPLSPSRTLVTVSDIETYGDTIFNAMWEQEDFGIMSGDVLKAYGDNIIKLAPVPEMMVMQPVYDAMYLHQFKNAKILHYSNVDISDIFQNPSAGTINQSIMMQSGLASNIEEALKQTWESNFILTSDFDNPTPEVVIESTRLMPTYHRSAIRFETGSEIAVASVYYRLTVSGALSSTEFGLIMLDSGASANVKTGLAIRSNFKYAPELQLGTIGASGWNYVNKDCYRFFEIDNYAVLSSGDLEKMHMAALMSLLAVPSIAKI